MENITHTTAKGTSEFGLTNTNKLIRHYQYATGLKTGYTSLAKYCISATAQKDGMNLIAVIMAAPDAKSRNADAVTLLNYGFGQCQLYQDANKDPLPPLKLQKGMEDYAKLAYESPFSYLTTDGSAAGEIEKKIYLPEAAEAPVKKGAVAGKAVYLLNGKEIGSVNICYTADIAAATYKDYFRRVLDFFL